MRAAGQFLGIFLIAFSACAAPTSSRTTRFDVREFGASGRRGDDARPAIQRAIEACSAAGGGTVVVPSGEYTSGTLELKSHVRFVVESGATIFSAKGRAAFPVDALFHGVDLDDVALEGRGTIDGRAEYEWRENDMQDDYIRPNLELAKAAGKSLRRSFPKPDSIGHLVELVRCTNVAIRELSFVRSPSWTIHLWGCERVAIDHVDVRTNLKDAVWADGIDPDGCRDLRISNCTIETGDDALVFYSTNQFGPARPCEDITVTNCRLTSSSSAIKFCDGNQNCVRRVAIDNCVITNSNRGLAFMVFDGGYISDVVISNVTIECVRRDWFWWGDADPIHFNIKRRCEISPQLPADKEPPAGAIRNVQIRNVIARGVGTSSISGHPTSPLENVTIDGLELHMAADPNAPYENAEHAISLHDAKNFTLRNVAVYWDEPASKKWRSALAVEHAAGLSLESFVARQADPDSKFPAILLKQVDHATIRDCRALPGTADFVHVASSDSHDIQFIDNDLREAQKPVSTDDVDRYSDEIHFSGDLERRP